MGVRGVGGQRDGPSSGIGDWPSTVDEKLRSRGRSLAPCSVSSRQIARTRAVRGSGSSPIRARAVCMGSVMTAGAGWAEDGGESCAQQAVVETPERGVGRGSGGTGRAAGAGQRQQGYTERGQFRACREHSPAAPAVRLHVSRLCPCAVP